MKATTAGMGVFVILFLFGIPIGLGADTPVSVPRIELVADRADSGKLSIAFVIGKDPVARVQELDPAHLNEVFPVWVGHVASQPTVSGRYRIGSDRVVFTPRFGFEYGLDYTAMIRRSVFDPPRAADIRLVVSRGGDVPVSVTRVVSIHPAGTVPENLLRFYISFSHPMRRGGTYRHVRLLGQDGSDVNDAFLELEPELWDADATRLTLLFDPGRIKRGLRPREDLGPALVEGESYTLRIDQLLEDADGVPMSEPFQHVFSVTGVDRVSPNPERWRVLAPASGSDVLILELDEPVDHALLLRMTTVADATGNDVPGDSSVADGGRRWTFKPDEAWRIGRYVIRVDVRLEDWAGNRVDGLFDEEMSDVEKAQSDGRDYVEIAFAVE